MELAYTTRKIVAAVVNSDDVGEVVQRIKVLGVDKYEIIRQLSWFS